MFDEERTKDFFRESRRMFNELHNEENQEQQGAAKQQAQADRRERIATQAMTGIVSNPNLTVNSRNVVSYEDPEDARTIARAVVTLADALIAELDKEEDNAD